MRRQSWLEQGANYLPDPAGLMDKGQPWARANANSFSKIPCQIEYQLLSTTGDQALLLEMLHSCQPTTYPEGLKFLWFEVAPKQTSSIQPESASVGNIWSC